MPTIAVIINAGSGADSDTDELKQRLLEAFNANGIEVKITIAESGEEIVEMAKQAAQGDYKIIVAGGGDGTVSAVAAEIIGTSKTLGVLPLGTLNHFSKDLNISAEPEEAVRVIAENHIEEIDAAEVNGQIFINNSSIGLYPQIVRRREKQQQRLGRGKWSAAFWAAIAVLRRYPFLKIKLTIDGKEFTRKTPFVFIGNNEYEMDSFNIGGRKCLDAGNLSVYVLHRTGRMGLVRLVLRSIFGRLRQAKDFETFCTDEITIETRRKKLLVAFDGEAKYMETPLRYRIYPNALRVIVPKKVNSE
ncbi:MAG: diacylglycerol kinase family lipid kinase [Acidobacteriota bacterium]|nr:diacylglycerol kinase family lipid kinase [Acidobacteriota bacterium]